MENNTPSINYPQFRKYAHGRTYFKIISSSEFEELQFLGDDCTVHRFTAKILPDRNYLYDLTFDYKKHWIAIEEQEYEAARRKCGSERQNENSED
jgi:hypothetical protein